MPDVRRTFFQRHADWLLAAVLAALLLACYAPALGGALLWDDPAHVTRADLRSWSGLVRIWTDFSAAQQYYPVLHSAFWVEHRLWGDNVLGYHLLNVLLHATACVLLVRVLRRWWTMPDGRRRVPAGAEWLAAFLFAVHPVFAESVAWISEQKNTLSLVFYLAAALAYLRFAERRRAGAYALAFGLFLLALGAKTVTATLPAALLVALWWRQGSLSPRRDVLPLLPWFGAALAAGLVTAWIERHFVGATGDDFALSFGQRLLLAGRILWFYLGKFVWPADLMFFYPRWNAAAPGLAEWAGLLAAIVVTLVLWRLRRRSRGPLAAWLLFGGSLFPALGFFNVFPFTFSYVADHFQYLAGASASAAAAAGAAWLLAAAPGPARRLGWGAAAVVIAGLAFLAREQAGLYRDNETLTRANLARNPDAWMAWRILGSALAKDPARAAEAIPCYERVIRLKPDYPDAYLGLAIELTKDPARRAEAIPLYERALQLRPYFVEAHQNLGVELLRLPGRQEEAMRHFELALQFRPTYAEAHASLAGILARMPGREAEALAHYTEAIRLNPTLAGLQHSFALYLVRNGQSAEALVHCEEAVRLRPDFFEARNSLGILYAQQGRFAEARAQWDEALRLNPQFAEARRNLDLLDRIPSP